MVSLTGLPDSSVTKVKEDEQILIINAIDDLEQVARARELTNIIWEINIKNNKTEQDWRKTEILLESYERIRDEFLESALLNLKKLKEVMNVSSVVDVSSEDDLNIGSF